MKLRYKRRKVQRYNEFYFSFLNWRKEIQIYLKDAPVNDPPKWFYKGSQIADLNRFINGECVNFAIALAKSWKLKPFVAISMDDNFVEGIGHAYCCIGNDKDGEIYIVDAKGMRKLSNALSDFSYISLDNIYSLDNAFLKEWISIFQNTRSKIKKQLTINKKLNKDALWYINNLFSEVKKDCLDFMTSNPTVKEKYV